MTDSVAGSGDATKLHLTDPSERQAGQGRLPVLRPGQGRTLMVAAMNFDNLVAVLAVAAAVPLILAAVPRVRVPGPVLEIVAGIVLGPAVLDLVQT